MTPPDTAPGGGARARTTARRAPPGARETPRRHRDRGCAGGLTAALTPAQPGARTLLLEEDPVVGEYAHGDAEQGAPWSCRLTTPRAWFSPTPEATRSGGTDAHPDGAARPGHDGGRRPAAEPPRRRRHPGAPRRADHLARHGQGAHAAGRTAGGRLPEGAVRRPPEPAAGPRHAARTRATRSRRSTRSPAPTGVRCPASRRPAGRCASGRSARCGCGTAGGPRTPPTSTSPVSSAGWACSRPSTWPRPGGGGPGCGRPSCCAHPACPRDTPGAARQLGTKGLVRQHSAGGR